MLSQTGRAGVTVGAGGHEGDPPGQEASMDKGPAAKGIAGIVRRLIRGEERWGEVEGPVLGRPASRAKEAGLILMAAGSVWRVVSKGRTR